MISVRNCLCILLPFSTFWETVTSLKRRLFSRFTNDPGKTANPQLPAPVDWRLGYSAGGRKKVLVLSRHEVYDWYR